MTVNASEIIMQISEGVFGLKKAAPLTAPLIESWSCPPSKSCQKIPNRCIAPLT